VNSLSVIVGNSSVQLGTKFAKKCKANLVKSEVRVFPDGESKITLKGKISSKKTIVIQSVYPPVDTNLIQALSLVSKAKEFSKEVILPKNSFSRNQRERLILTRS
jgi:ribose-phosphate pyrophosphokinase